MELFSAKTGAINYGIICIGYAIGGYIGPIIAAKQFANYGTYHTSYIILCIAGIVAMIYVLILKWFESHEKYRQCN